MESDHCYLDKSFQLGCTMILMEANVSVVRFIILGITKKEIILPDKLWHSFLIT